MQSYNEMTLLFLYYASHIVHTRFQVPEQYVHKFNFIDKNYRKYYEAMTKYLYDVVGELVGLLKERFVEQSPIGDQQQQWNGT